MFEMKPGSQIWIENQIRSFDLGKESGETNRPSGLL